MLLKHLKVGKYMSLHGSFGSKEEEENGEEEEKEKKEVSH